MVRGTRKVTEDKLLRLDQSFDVPENTIVEKISGRLENGYLTLILPFRKPAKIDQEKSTSVEETRKRDTQKKPESGEKKDEDAQKGKPKDIDEKKDEPMKKRDEDDIQKKSESIEEKDERPKGIQESMQGIQKKLQSTEEKKDEPTQQETTKVSEKMLKSNEEVDRDEPDTIQEEKKEHDSNIDMEKKIEEFARNAMPKGISEISKRAEGVMEMISKRAEEVMEKTSKKVEESVKKAKGSRKRGPIWRDGGEDGKWLEFGSIDNLLEKVKRNKKAIAVAVVAFSVGFYVSHKMRTNGR